MRLGKVPEKRVAGNHAKPLRRSYRLRGSTTVGPSRSIVTSPFDIICDLNRQRQFINTSLGCWAVRRRFTYIAFELDNFKLAIGALVVELRLPVIAVIENLVASGILRRDSLLIRLCQGKVGSPSYSMNVRGNLAWRDNRVASLSCQWLTIDGE